jgi:hypothetical protein
MRLKGLSPELRSRIAKLRWDRIIEKHEGPWDWKSDLDGDYVEFVQIGGLDVLLPIDKENHKNITIDRCIELKDGNTLTIFSHDRTYDPGIDMDMLAGRLAVCEKVPEQDWYIATVYHECWINRLESNR